MRVRLPYLISGFQLSITVIIYFPGFWMSEFDLIHYFAVTQSDFQKSFPKFKKYLSAKGSLWVSWPKTKKLNTDLSLTKVIELGYDHGLVESKTISINDDWSAIKFTHPKPGKIYNNSYGQLKT